MWSSQYIGHGSWSENASVKHNNWKQKLLLRQIFDKLDVLQQKEKDLEMESRL